MKKLILLAILLFIMAANNPSKDEYVNWAKSTIKANSNQFVGLGVDVLGSPILNNSTTTDDYKIFTVFKTNVLGEKFTVLGIFHKFIPLPHPQSTNQPQK